MGRRSAEVQLQPSGHGCDEGISTSLDCTLQSLHYLVLPQQPRFAIHRREDRPRHYEPWTVAGKQAEAAKVEAGKPKMNTEN